MDARSSGDEEKQKHTALVYFHGVGEQKRYEEVSRLVDELIRYEPKIEHSIDSSSNKKISIEFEPTQADMEEKIGRTQIGYIPVSYNGKEYRFYEAYYADLIAGGVPALKVLFWLIRLSYRPLKILFFTIWRALPRLRRAILLGAWNKLPQAQHDLEEKDTGLLLKLYDEFGKWEAAYNERYQKGRFREFVRFIRDHSVDAERLVWRARKWWMRFIRIQLTLLLLVLTFLLTLGLIAIGVFRFIVQLPAHELPLGWNILIGAIILGLGWGLSAFLRNYVGDLYFWSSYEETSEKYRKREDILNRCCAYLSHVLSDTNCDRVVLVGHSMGTTVAYDTVLRLGRTQPKLKPDKNSKEAKPIELDRIQHVITLASVIDKVYYLFETVTSRSYQYNWIIETLRGDIGTYPFSAQKKVDVEEGLPIPRIHWINFWDRADVASGALYTPANHVFNPYQVDNYEVAGSCFPDPSTAHLDYFKNPIVLDSIFEAFFKDAHSFVRLPNLAALSETELKTQIESQSIGKYEKPHGFTDVCQRVAALTPWLILLYWLSPRFIPAIASIPFFPALGLYIVVIVAFGSLDWVIRSWQNRVAKPRPQPNGKSASA